ncbi:MAG: Xaa-Pro peptidase family protein [Pusillimonas sp.]
MENVELSFSEREYLERVSAVRARMQELEMEVAILDQVETMVWLSGFGISETLWRCCVVPLEGDPFLIVRSLDLVPARERTWLEDIVGFRDWDDPVAILRHELEKRGLHESTIGIEFSSQSMSLHRYKRLKSELPAARFIDLGQALWVLRTIKSEAEIDYHKKAGAVCDAALANAVKVVRIGCTQRDVIRAASATYLEMGADTGPVGPITTGHGWGALHGNEHSTPVDAGTIVHVELVPRVRGYSTRIMRSVIAGEPTVRQQEVAAHLIRIQDAQLAAIVPGADARDVDELARRPILELGLRPHYENITGYTLGCFPATTQIVSDFSHAFTPAANWRIQEGMVLHMYVSAEGLAFSESIVVRTRGVERLTKTERRLFSVPI